MRRAMLLVFVAAAAGCADTLPDQDRRIRVAPTAAKLPADILWKEYQANETEANRAYWGKAIEVSGKVTRIDAQDSPHPYVLFGQTETHGVRANLLDDDAQEILKSVAAGDRIRLRCFCAGLDGHVILKSCVRPD